MNWTEVAVTTSSEAVEAVANILVEAGSSGVAIEDALDIQNFQSDNFGEIIDKSNFNHIKEGAIVSAYFPETLPLPEIIATIKERLSHLSEFHLDPGLLAIDVKDLAETSWETAWKKYYHPIRLTRHLTIVPSWIDYTAQQSDEYLLKLDPGMAFGTGTHPTTILSLQALETMSRGGETVLDVGTGSGVLSIAAKHFGAKTIYAYDLDQVAVDSAKENFALNDYAQDINIQANDLLTNVTHTGDIIVANILADIIMQMLADANKLLNQDGCLILSGIIQDKADMVLSEAKRLGFTLYQTLQMEDWICYILKKSEEI